MRLLENVQSFVESNAVLTLPVQETALGYSLASLSAIDDDEHLFRRVTQQTRDLGAITSERQREISYHLADVNPFAKRIIDMSRDFVVGDVSEWRIEAENPKTQELLDWHWEDPINNWPEKLEERVREWALSGEQCYTAKLGKDGIVRLGYVDPGFIHAVARDSDNIEILTEVILKKKATDEAKKKLKVIRWDQEQMAIRGLEGDGSEEGDYVGQCFYFALNKPTNATRGRSDLFALADALDMLDNFHFSRMERAALINAFFWDVTVEGANQAELEELAQRYKVPKPGTQRIHNEKMTYEAVTPNLQAVDAAEEGKLMRVPMLVGAGTPDHWLVGMGDNANRATAYEMSDPPIRMYNSRQRRVVNMVRFILMFQIEEAIRDRKLANAANARAFKVHVPEISKRDTERVARTLNTSSQALATARLGDLVTHEKAVKMFAFLASQTGFDIDGDEEWEALQGQEIDQEKKDVAGLMLPDRSDEHPGDK